MLDFLRQLTLDPENLDASPLRAAGLSPDAIRDAVYVCTLFNLIDRLTDTFDFHIPSDHDFEMSARFLVKRGYR